MNDLLVIITFQKQTVRFKGYSDIVKLQVDILVPVTERIILFYAVITIKCIYYSTNFHNAHIWSRATQLQFPGC